MWESVGIIFQVFIPIALLVLGFVVGGMIERAHFRSLERREAANRSMIVTDLKTLPPGVGPAGGGRLVTGSVVVGADYFKTFAAGLRKLIGGEVRSFDRMMERARREAMCRLLEESRSMGAIAVINVRMDTASIGAMSRNPSPMAEVIASGTAILPSSSA